MPKQQSTFGEDNRALNLIIDNLPSKKYRVLLESFQGHDSISQPFEFHMDVRAQSSASGPPSEPLNLLFRYVIGSEATITLQRPKPSNKPVIFNGIITSFGSSDPAVYTATLRPTLWKLTLTNKYRLHKNLTPLGVIEYLLSKHSVKYSTRITGALPSLRCQDWLQSGETDFELMMQMMQKVGIYYYFVHGQKADGKYYHKVILADHDNYNPEPKEKLVTRRTFTEPESFEYDDLVTTFNYSEELAASTVRTVMADTKAAWEISSPQSVHMETAARTKVGNSNQSNADLSFEQYFYMQYGINQNEAELYRDESLGKLRSSLGTFSGESSCARFNAGQVFTSIGNRRKDLDDQYVLTSVSHSCSVYGQYQNQFHATAIGYSIAPYTLQDTFPGPTIATVVEGPGTIVNEAILDDEGCIDAIQYIHLDKFDPQTNKFKASCKDAVRKGVYVVFPWDEKQTVHWVQISQSMQTVPEKGVTVLISRSQDSSDVPEVMGIIRADGNYVVTPDDATHNTSIGNSSNYQIGDTSSASDGDSEHLSCGDNLSVSIGKNGRTITSLEASELAHAPAKAADPGGVKITLVGGQKLAAPKSGVRLQENSHLYNGIAKCTGSFDFVNFSYGDSYSYSHSAGKPSRSISVSDMFSLNLGDSTSSNVAKRKGNAFARDSLKKAEAKRKADDSKYDNIRFDHGTNYSYSNTEKSGSHKENRTDSYGDNVTIHTGDSVNAMVGSDYGDRDTAQSKALAQQGCYNNVNVTYSSSYNYADNQNKENYSEQHGDNNNKHFGNNTSYQKGDNTNTQTGNSYNTQSGTITTNRSALVFSFSASAALLTASIHAGISISSHVGISINVITGISMEVNLLRVYSDGIKVFGSAIGAKVDPMVAKVQALEGKVNGLAKADV